jgi:hypothetical protein
MTACEQEEDDHIESDVEQEHLNFQANQEVII